MSLHPLQPFLAIAAFACGISSNFVSGAQIAGNQTIPETANAVVTTTKPAVTGPVAFFDLTDLFELNLNDESQRHRFWDEAQLAVSLQGLVNRTAPHLFIRYLKDPDDFWWELMTGTNGWLAGLKIDRINNLDGLLKQFRSYYNGLVVWDERVPATANLAATIAGCDDLLAVRFDPREGSLYRRLTEGPEAMPIKVRLSNEDGSPLFTGRGTVPGTSIPSSGSAKCDAYLWLIENYVKTGKTDPHWMGFYMDSFWFKCWQASGAGTLTLPNEDFVIAHRGVILDLNVWDDESPVDDPDQRAGTDVATLQKLLLASYQRFDGDGVIQVAGFIPWAFKYTSFRGPKWSAGGHHEPVAAEWRYADILSSYNAFMDADALGLCTMANASFYQHYPLAKHYPQSPKPTTANLASQGFLDATGHVKPCKYVAFYVGDYDSAAWLYQKLPEMWRDPARGRVPLSWAFNPNLCQRFPLGMAWAREHGTANDWFVTGDSGAGYINPGNLTPPRAHSGLPSGLAAWENHCQPFYRQWDITLTGFIIDGDAPGLSSAALDAYARFSPDGIVAQKIGERGVHQGMPFLRMGSDLDGSPQEAARIIVKNISGSPPEFSVFRSILKTPTWHLGVQQELQKLEGDNIKVVDLYTLLQLVREYEAKAGK